MSTFGGNGVVHNELGEPARVARVAVEETETHTRGPNTHSLHLGDGQHVFYHLAHCHLHARLFSVVVSVSACV